MTRDTAEAVEQDRMLTSVELDAISGGMRKAGGDPATEIEPVFGIGGGSGAGKVHISDISISKILDKSSAVLW